MRKLALFFTIFFIFSCSNTKVHLYSQYLNKQEVETISERLSSQNLTVVPNTLKLPNDINESTLLYSPLVENREVIELINTSLSELGWQINDVKPLVAGNHYYTKNSIALMLIPEGSVNIEKQQKLDVINTYNSQQCKNKKDQDIKLQLNADNSYQLIDTPTSKHTAHLTGTWQITGYPYIRLTASNNKWHHYFQIVKDEQSDQISKITTTTLKPLRQHHIYPKCHFIFGIRN